MTDDFFILCCLMYFDNVDCLDCILLPYLFLILVVILSWKQTLQLWENRELIWHIFLYVPPNYFTPTSRNNFWKWISLMFGKNCSYETLRWINKEQMKLFIYKFFSILVADITIISYGSYGNVHEEIRRFKICGDDL